MKRGETRGEHPSESPASWKGRGERTLRVCPVARPATNPVRVSRERPPHRRWFADYFDAKAHNHSMHITSRVPTARASRVQSVRDVAGPYPSLPPIKTAFFGSETVKPPLNQ